MAGCVLGWVDVALDHYLALPLKQQELIDARIGQMLDDPGGSGSSYDRDTDWWTTTDQSGAGVIVYVFRPDRPRLVILRLVY